MASGSSSFPILDRNAVNAERQWRRRGRAGISSPARADRNAVNAERQWRHLH